MSTDHVSVRWTGKRQMVAWDEAGHGDRHGRACRSTRAKARARGRSRSFLQALAACTGDGRRLRPREEASARHAVSRCSSTATQREDEFPKIYTRIELEYVVTGYGVKPAAVARAIELSEDKYCSVRGHARTAGPGRDVVPGRRGAAPCPATTLRRSERVRTPIPVTNSARNERTAVSDAVLLPVYNEAVHRRCRARRGARLLRRRGHRGRRRLDRRDAPGARRARRHHGRAPRPQLRLRLRAARSASASRTSSGVDAAHHHGLRRAARAGAHPAVPLGAGRGAATSSRAAATCPGARWSGAAPESRQAINQRITAEINAVTGWGLTDAFCGFKAYRLPALDCIRLDEPGYAMPLELWAKAWQCGLSVREIPVERIYCDHERSFGAALDDPETRYAYYLDVWSRALEGDS